MWESMCVSVFHHSGSLVRPLPPCGTRSSWLQRCKEISCLRVLKAQTAMSTKPGFFLTFFLTFFNTYTEIWFRKEANWDNPATIIQQNAAELKRTRKSQIKTPRTGLLKILHMMAKYNWHDVSALSKAFPEHFYYNKLTCYLSISTLNGKKNIAGKS